jgi:hypothetical protein
MERCGAHPVRLMLADGRDNWRPAWSHNACRVAFSCLVELIGDERTTSSIGSELLVHFQSLVYGNYDRLRRNCNRTSKHKERLSKDLDELYDRVLSKQ